jgi:hypothetical protein
MDFLHAVHVLESAGVVKAVDHGEVLGVVGDSEVAVAAGQGGFGHLANSVRSVGRDGVGVDVAAYIGCGDEVW